MMAGLGWPKKLHWKFQDKNGKEIQRWSDLIHLDKIIRPSADNPYFDYLTSVTVAADVQNPLLGPNGCTQIYGPQKGFREEDIPRAESALTRLAEVWESQTGEDAASLAGAGAAGRPRIWAALFCGSSDTFWF